MAGHAEAAIRLAILNHPQTFGLTTAEVNPMLLYVQRSIEQGESHGSVELWKHCFDLVNTTLHHKVIEVFTGLSVVQGEAQAAAIAAESNDEAEPEPERKPESARRTTSRRSSGNSRVIGSPGRELSTNQLRYMGYLIRQLGDVPDYSIIAKLSQKEATLRIKELEAKVNGR